MTIRLPTGRLLMDLPFDVFTSASVKYGVPSLSRPVGVGTFIVSEVHSRPILFFDIASTVFDTARSKLCYYCVWGQRRRADGYAAKNKGRYLLYPTLATIAPQPCCYLSVLYSLVSNVPLSWRWPDSRDKNATKKRPKSDRKSDLDITVTSSCTTFGGLGILFFG